MNWILVPQQFMTGILNGGTLALIALGIVLIYKSSEVFNFAHGHMVMLGAFLVWFFAGGTSQEASGMPFALPFGVAVVAAITVAVLVGLAIERFTLRPMTGQPLLAIILVTLGLAQLLEGTTTLLFGTQPKGFPSPIDSSSVITIEVPPINGQSIVFLDRIILKQVLVVTFVVAIIAAVIFILFFRFTRAGLRMRATSENHELARSVGIKVPRVFGMSWAIAGIIATIGGILLAMVSGVSINLATVALVAFPAILLGGLESFGGAIFGGLIVGLVAEMVKASTVIQVRNSAEIAPYVLILIVLIIRPEGLFGRKRIERV
ncbi:MAG: branched-chain amino acid ABC transporter permease [Anaerolineae bacterium]|nr:branched-chain amino acid ABC transporter permease [Anaerolineae bacterium]MCO5195603.1 branched-chain amino acid ABC transporter permease [Anaerolineae bacterium]